MEGRGAFATGPLVPPVHVDAEAVDAPGFVDEDAADCLAFFFGTTTIDRSCHRRGAITTRSLGLRDGSAEALHAGRPRATKSLGQKRLRNPSCDGRLF